MFYEKLLGLLGGAVPSPESEAAKWYLNNKKQVGTLRNCVCVCVRERDLLHLTSPFDHCSRYCVYCDGGGIEEPDLLSGELPGLSDHQLPQPAAAFSLA